MGRAATLSGLSLLLVAAVAILPAPCAAESDYYAELGVDRDASDAQIKKAFRKLSLQLHPDKNPGDEAIHEQFLRVSRAYEVLSDPDKKHVYDVRGDEGVKEYEQQAAGGGQQMNPFGAFFGGGGGGVRRGPDFRMQFEVTLEDLYNGGQKSFNIKRKVICKACRGSGAKGGETKKCPACGGRGVVMKVQQLGPGFNVQMQQPCDKCGGKGQIFKHACPICNGERVVDETKELQATIEKGMPDGHELVFERMSEQTPDGAIPGNVIIQLKTRSHIRFTRRNNDLLMKMTITLKEALLGFTRTVRQLDGRDITVQRSEVTYPGQIITIEGEGMPVHEVPSERGNLEITFEIKFPESLSQSQQDTIRQILS